MCAGLLFIIDFVIRYFALNCANAVTVETFSLPALVAWFAHCDESCSFTLAQGVFSARKCSWRVNVDP
jgi:hypothetical protein